MTKMERVYAVVAIIYCVGFFGSIGVAMSETCAETCKPEVVIARALSWPAVVLGLM